MPVDVETQLYELLDAVVDSADDDELFACAYLQGHLTVALGKAESENDPDLKQLFLNVTKSLDAAFHAGELSPADQSLVKQFWHRLYQKIQ